MHSIGGEWEAQQRGAFKEPHIDAPDVGVEFEQEGNLPTAPLSEFLTEAELKALEAFASELKSRLKAT